MSKVLLSSTEEIIDKMKQNWFISDASEIAVKIHRLHHFYLEELNSVIQPSQLTVAEFNVLMSLRRESAPQQLTPKNIAKYLLFSSGGLTKIINKLISKGLIVDAPNPQDQRSKTLLLTHEGCSLVESLYYDLNQVREQNVSVLSVDEMLELNRLLSKIIKQKSTIY
ncbi:MarR family winged helix-turn-helix transcriptional regulator [Motilimonas cestriensis]|uniref:MarR family winged helix-turn-helix transcriptional regulator n=1 Tax=Motilimonas cestriensis TaxID=2742685 RepID=UPI003DA21A15